MKPFKLNYPRIFLYLFLLFLSLIPIFWFVGKGNVLINGIDTNFPLDLGTWFFRRFYVWNPLVNAGIDFSSSTAGLFFHFIQFFPYILGFKLQTVQIISLVFWFSLVIFSSYFYSSLIFKNKLSQLLFVVFYSFNIYLFNTWENVKVANLSLVAGLPLFLSILTLLKDKKISYFRAGLSSTLLGIIVSGTGINPAYFITLFFISFLALLGFLFSEKKGSEILRRFQEFIFVSFFIVLVNLFWLLPTAKFISINITPGGSLDKIGFTNWINSLSENTSILNILRLQGAWDWYAFDSMTGLPLYIPYALNYFYRHSFILFSFLIPTLAFISLIFVNKGKRHLYISFGLMIVVGAFLGAGTHLPTGSFYSLLYYELPFFTLFRSPWYIFTLLLTLAFAGLIGLLFDELSRKIEKNLHKKILFVFGLILVLGNLIYNYPLIQGKIFRPGRHDSFYVEFPPYVFEAKDWLSKNKEGRIINYPEDEIEEFKWGYRGIESIIGLLSDQEMLFSPLNAPDAPIAKIFKEFYANSRKEQIASAYSILSKLSAKFIFEKTDQKSISMELPDQYNGLDKKTFGSWNFYQLPEDKMQQKVFIADKSYLYYDDPLPVLLTPLKTADILINSRDRVIKDLPTVIQSSGSIIAAKNSQTKDFNGFINSQSRLSNRLVSRDVSKVEYNFSVPISSNYQILLERYKIENFGIKTSDTQKAIFDGKEIDLHITRADDSYVYFEPIEVSSGTHTIVFNLNNPNIIAGGKFDQLTGFNIKGEGKTNLVKENNESYLMIENKHPKDLYMTYSLSRFDPLIPLMISLKYRQIYGDNAQVLLGQSNDLTLLKTISESLPNHPEWQQVSFYYDPVKTDSNFDINLVAPQTKDPLGTTVLYDDLRAFKVFNNNLLLIKTSDQNIISNSSVSYAKKSPVDYQVQVEGIVNPHLLVFSENYSPEWQIRLKDEEGQDVRIKPLHFSANLYANAWYIEGAPVNYSASIYYNPQKLFWMGLALSIIIPIILLLVIKVSSKKDHE